jgi:hypothetical protein
MSNSEDLPKTAAAATALGVTRYFTGAPCCNGHIVPRFTLGRTCSECKRGTGYAWRKAFPDKYRAQSRRIQQRHRDAAKHTLATSNI